MSTARNEAEVVLERVEVRLGGRRILSDIDLRLARGEFVTVVGRSGSGKSTLLRVLAGLQEPTRGRLQVGSRPIVVFQEPRLLPWRSVLQNVCLGMAKTDPVAGRAVLERVGLGDRAQEYPTALSGGQRQRVALARALIHRPQLMLLDEPFGALDALTRISAQRLVEELWGDGGFTALLVTHDVEEAVLLGDRVLVIEEGRIAQELVVDLPRPRARKSPAVGALASQLLRAIFGSEEPVQGGAPAPAASDAAGV